MKSWKIVVPMVMMVCLASSALAQTTAPTASPMKGHFTITGMGGLEVPTGDLSDKDKGFDQNLGWDAGGAVDYFITDQIAIGADVAYFATKNKDAIVDSTGADTGAEAKAKTMAFGVHAKWFMPTGGGKIMPWLGAGVGMYNRKFEITERGASLEFKDNKVGGWGGVGVDYRMTEMVALGVNGAYHFSSKFEDTQSIGGFDVTASSDNWSFITFNAALTLHFPMGGGAAK